MACAEHDVRSLTGSPSMRTQLQYDCRRDDAHEQHTKYQVSGMSPKLRLGLREEAQFEEDLLELTPFLRSFARALSQNQETAQDLTQETLLRAWQARATFKAGTNLKGWLCVILRNKFYSDFRRTRREVDWDQEEVSSIACWRSEQAGAIDLSDTVRAL